MNIKEKLKFIEDNHLIEWIKTRQVVENELSDSQGMFCCCGKLATGLHEMNCQRFKNKITSETLKRLKHLFVK